MADKRRKRAKQGQQQELLQGKTPATETVRRTKSHQRGTNIEATRSRVLSAPFEIVHEDDGLAGVDGFAALAESEKYRDLGAAIRQAQLDGGNGAWDDIASFAVVVGVTETVAKKLVTAHDHPEYLMPKKLDDLESICRNIDLRMQDYLPDPVAYERIVLTQVVQGLNGRRIAKRELLGELHFDPSESFNPTWATVVHLLANELVALDDAILRKPANFEAWHSETNSRFKKRSLGCFFQDEHWQLVNGDDLRLRGLICGVADWIAARQFLDWFKTDIRRRALHVLKQRRDEVGIIWTNARDLVQSMRLLEELTNAFIGFSGNYGEVARRFGVGNAFTLKNVVEGLGLKMDAFTKDGTRVTRLLMQSPKLEPLVRKLLLHEDQYPHKRHSEGRQE